MKVKTLIVVFIAGLLPGRYSSSVQLTDSNSLVTNARPGSLPSPNPSNQIPTDTPGSNYGSYSGTYGSQEPQNQYQYGSSPQNAVQQQYYPYYYPQYQYAQGKLAFGGNNQDGGQGGLGGFSHGGQGMDGGGGNLLGGLGGNLFGGGGNGGDSSQNDGILGMLTSVFSGLFNMMGMGDDSDMMAMGSQQGDSGAGGYGWPAETMHSMGGGGGGGGGGAGGGGGLGGIILAKKGALLKKFVVFPALIILTILVILGILFILYFIPIPVINPDDMEYNKDDKWKKSLAGRMFPPVEETMRLARSVLQSDECVERLSCEIARYAKSYAPNETVTSKLDGFSNKWVRRISRSLKTARTGSCVQFTCPRFTIPFQRVERLLNLVTSDSDKRSKSEDKSEKTSKF